MTLEEIDKRLWDLAEEKNARRSSSIIPGAKPILGARMPDLRKLAKEIVKDDYQDFLINCPDEYFEHQALKAFVLGYAKDEIEILLSYADRLIPDIRDWAVNDAFCQTFSVARKHRRIVWEWLESYAKKQEEYAQRVVAVLSLSHFLVDEYIDRVLAMMNCLRFDAYYTKMGVAWCVATAYAKYPKQTQNFLQNNLLDDWTYNKSIQKMLESYRVSGEDKIWLREMKRK